MGLWILRGEEGGVEKLSNDLLMDGGGIPIVVLC